MHKDSEAEGRGLLLVELLDLPRKFSWRRYRADLGGFLLAWGFVAVLMLLLVGIARADEIPPVDARLQTRGVHTPMKFQPYSSREAWEKRAKHLREQILMSAGLWPIPERTPLNARVFDKLDRDGYTVEKAYFESYPGFYCTGNLYRPVATATRSGPFPAVWSPHGHWNYGRLEHSEHGSVVARAINLARQGYVVFTPDMVGYNDSLQVSHQFGGPRPELWGISVLGLQLWNGIRGLDFLESLSDVDRTRLLVTGASGGGTQTFLLTAVDERVKASAPVNMVSAHMQGGSNCENAPNLRLDTFNIETVALTAPRPLLMVSATGDWTKNTPAMEFPAVQSIYKLMGAEDRVSTQQFDAPHNYNKDSREAVYAFLARWALGETDAAKFKERSVRPDFPSQMLVFYGRERDKGLDEDELVEQRVAVAERQLAALKPTDAASLSRFREVMGAALRHSVAAEMPVAADLLVNEGLGAGGKLLLGRRGRGDRVAADVWWPKRRIRGASRVVFIVHPEGSAGAGKSAMAAELLRRGIAVFSIDAFQTGEHKGTRVAPERPDRFFTTYNRTDDAERVQDILTGLAYLKSRPEFGAVDLVGLDRAGLWVLLARALAPADAVRRTIADAGRFASDSDSEYVEKLPIPLIRRAGDFRTVTALIAPAELLVHNTDGVFNTEWAREAYQAAAKDGALVVKDSPAELKELAAWLK